jgi:hypothetical protein
MTMPKPGDRIEHWLLTDDSPFARQMDGGRVEQWEHDAEFEDDPDGRAAWDADPLGQIPSPVRNSCDRRNAHRHRNTSEYGLRDDRVFA